MEARPVHRPDCRATGARPDRLAGLLAVECSKLRHPDDEGESRNPGHACNSWQDFELAGEPWIGFEPGLDLSLDGFDLLVDLGQPLHVLTFEQWQAELLFPVLCGGPIFDERFAGRVKLFELVQDLRSWASQLEVQEGSHAGEVFRIDPVCLGKLAGRLGKAATLPWIDLQKRQPFVGKSCFRHAMIRPCWLEHNARNVRLAYESDQRLVFSGIVGKASASAV